MHPSQQLFFQFSFVCIYTDTGASELEIVKGISSLSHSLAADRGKIVFFYSLLLYQGVREYWNETWDSRESAEQRRATKMGAKKGILLTQMCKWPHDCDILTYITLTLTNHAAKCDTWSKWRAVFAWIFTLPFKQRFMRHTLIVLPRCDTCSAATGASAFRVGLERVRPWAWTLAVGKPSLVIWYSCSLVHCACISMLCRWVSITQELTCLEFWIARQRLEQLDGCEI